MRQVILSFSICLVVLGLSACATAQAGGKISGKVAFGDGLKPLSGASVTIVPIGRSAVADENGKYEFSGIPAGRYTVIAHFAGFQDAAKSLVLAPGGNEVVDFLMQLTGVKEQVTITATGDKQAAFDAIQPTITVGSSNILEHGSVGLGDALSDQPGVAMRSATPASSRPVIRGFDGDRVLVAIDGFRDGSVAALSENHAEPIDLMSLDRIEVVRGPSTLLYGSNAFGGVVNAISRHDEDFQSGLRGYFTAIGGSTNGQAAASGGAEYGVKNWMLWGSGSGLRTGDYRAGDNFGTLENTFVRNGSGNGGFGYFGCKDFFTANYNYYRNRYGIPIDPEDPEERTETIGISRHNVRFSGGFRDLNSFIESIKFTFDYSKYSHRESEIFEGDPLTLRFTDFNNKVYSYRGVFSQKKHENLSGTFGLDGYYRQYLISGDETLLQGSVTQNLNSVFALEQIDLEHVTFQFGGRVENSRYRPTNLSLINRDLTGFSGAVGMRVGLWNNGAFTANFSHSARLPDLEEFYNNGPHDDTVSFEIGNPNLKKETSDSIDLSLRHQGKRFRADANFFYYNIRNFVFLMPTGEVDEDTELPVALYVQGDSHFTGAEANAEYDVNRYLNLFSGVDYVRAKLNSGVDLPRIPPLRGRLGFEAHTRGFTVRPELILVADQDRVFTNETRTPGYSVFNITGSYTFIGKHIANTFAVNAFNLTDRLYFNHVSFIKDYAPEIGRGVRFSYTLRFF
jgi:iron complex outermembrane receptor protein